MGIITADWSLVAVNSLTAT